LRRPIEGGRLRCRRGVPAAATPRGSSSKQFSRPTHHSRVEERSWTAGLQEATRSCKKQMNAATKHEQRIAPRKLRNELAKLAVQRGVARYWLPVGGASSGTIVIVVYADKGIHLILPVRFAGSICWSETYASVWLSRPVPLREGFGFQGSP